MSNKILIYKNISDSTIVKQLFVKREGRTHV